MRTILELREISLIIWRLDLAKPLTLFGSMNRALLHRFLERYGRR
jgi:hypothetical protein